MSGAIGKQVAVSDSAVVKIVAKGRAAHVKNEGAKTVYLGGSAVTSAAGYALVSGAELPDAYVADIDELYGICATGEATTVHVLAFRTRESQ